MESLHMRTIRKILMACSLILPFAASAQSLSDMQALSEEDRRAYIESMSEDERAAMQGKWRAEFEALPKEQKAAIREQRQGHRNGEQRGRDREAMRQRWDTMSEEERSAARDRFRANGEKRRAHWESMSEEERAAAREKRGEHKGQRQGGHHKGNAGAGKADSGAEPES
jgi:hypothetical protein